MTDDPTISRRGALAVFFGVSAKIALKIGAGLGRMADDVVRVSDDAARFTDDAGRAIPPPGWADDWGNLSRRALKDGDADPLERTIEIVQDVPFDALGARDDDD